MVLENQSLSFCLSVSAGPGNRSVCTYFRGRKEEEEEEGEKEQQNKQRKEWKDG